MHWKGVWEMIFKKSMCKCLGKKIVENGGLNTRARDMRKWLRRGMERWFWWLAKSVVRAFEGLGRHFSYFDIANSIYNSLNPVKSCNFPKAKMIEVSWWYIVYYKKPLKMKMWFSWLRICGYCVSRYFGDILGYSCGWKISMAMVEMVWEELLKLGGWGDTWLPWGRPHTAYHNLQ